MRKAIDMQAMIEKLIAKYEDGEDLPDEFDQGAATGVVLSDLNALLKACKMIQFLQEKVV